MVAKKILIVDDEEDITETLGFRLKTAGYSVVTARDGVEGVAKAIHELPDLILLDVMMPGMNGFEMCREVRQNEATKNIPVIMLTAKSQDSDRQWGMELGATDYVDKPFDAMKLLEKVRAILK